MKKWFYAAFAEKEPTAQDKILFKKVEVFEQDMLRQDKEDADVD